MNIQLVLGCWMQGIILDIQLGNVNLNPKANGTSTP